MVSISFDSLLLAYSNGAKKIVTKGLLINRIIRVNFVIKKSLRFPKIRICHFSHKNPQQYGTCAKERLKVFAVSMKKSAYRKY